MLLLLCCKLCLGIPRLRIVKIRTVERAQGFELYRWHLEGQASRINMLFICIPTLVSPTSGRAWLGRHCLSTNKPRGPLQALTNTREARLESSDRPAVRTSHAGCTSGRGPLRLGLLRTPVSVRGAV